MEETYTLSIADYNEYGDPCVLYVNYCKRCAERAEEDGLVLKTLEEEDLWLNPKPSKCRYSTNWMGPAGLWWYEERGLLNDKKEITEHYSCGRIDVRGGDTDIYYGDEIGVPPMRSEDWTRFGDWLDTFETDFMWTLDQLVELYERKNPKIRWADND
jgi:hypothetical protein